MIIQLFKSNHIQQITLRSNHPQQIIVGHLNINSIRNKFDMMKPMLLDDIDIFMLTETKMIPFQLHNLMLNVLGCHLD